MTRAAISLIFLMFSGAFGQDSPGARAILDKVIQASRAGRSYRTEISGSAENEGTKIAVAGNALFQSPGKFRAELKIGPNEVLMVGDGSQTWIYQAAAKSYRRVTAGSPDASMLAGGTANGLAAAQRAPDEDVTLNGSLVHCYVIAADRGINHFIFWIDQTNYVILRAKASAVHTALDFQIDKLTWEPALTGKEFVFTPPEGATELTNPTAGGTIQAATLVKRVNPEYPKDAKAAHIQGAVRFTGLLGKDGTVKDLQLISGHPLLVQAAMDAVKHWVYQPTLLNGEAVEVRTEIVVNFRLEGAATPDGANRLGSGATPPHVISKEEPHYSVEGLMARLEGNVRVSLVVSEDGTPKNIKVVKSLGLGLDEKAIEAIGEWQFAPGQKDGNAVAVRANVEVNFRLAGKAGEWRLARAEFKPPEAASLPILLRTKFPRDSSAGEPGSVVLTMDVDERGRPVNLHVEKSSDAQWEEEVMGAAREWRFKAGENGGAPVAVPLTLEFSKAGVAPTRVQ